MKQILIATHGKMASGIRYTAELIVGKMDEITTIDAYVTPEDNVEKKFEEYFAQHENDRIFVFTDLMGGSVNQKLLGYSQKENVTLITGTNLPVLMQVLMADDDVTEDEIQEFIDDAREELQVVDFGGGKKSTSEKNAEEDTAQGIENTAQISEGAASYAKKSAPKKALAPQSYDNSTAKITALRVDDRLIHGQVALTLALPIGILGLQIKTVLYIFIVGMFAKTFDRLAAEGKEKQIVALHYGLWAVNWFLYSLFAFFGILFGSDAVSALLDAIPDVVMNGLTVCGGLLPAVGMAMLMKILWDNKICMFYFLGFVLAAYLKLPLIALAVIGVIIAISIGMNDYKLNQLAAQRVAASPAGGSDEYLDEEEEEFFS